MKCECLELIGIGKKQRALETLLEVITSRRHRTWTKMHEPLMEKFLDLCVDLKKSQVAKDGLYQYKAISQTVRFAFFERGKKQNWRFVFVRSRSNLWKM